MKTRLAVLLTGLTCLLATSVSSRGAVEVSFSAGIEIDSPNDFYEPLEPYGEWVTVGTYGRCWHPIEVEPGWRPYCEGHWEWTDCGWYWVSEEPWSWACYHYGSWVNDPGYGWCWIPNTEWAPAWVTWRESPNYIGWAPCGPGGAVLAPSLFVFVDTHRFHERVRPNTVIVNNTTIINRTRVINDIRRVDRDFDGRRRRVVINEGPRVDIVARASGRTISPRPIREVVRQTPVPERIRRTGTIDRPVLREDNVRNRRTTEERQREGTRGEVQRDRQVSPTGRDQQRTYEQPNRQQQPSEQGRPDQRLRPSTPTTREQPRLERTPNVPERREQVQPQQPNRVTPERPLPPTGRDQPRTYEQPQRQQQPPEQVRPDQRLRPTTPATREQIRPERTPNTPERREQTEPQQPNRVSPQQPLPPTGRDQPRVRPEPEQRAPVPQRPEQIRPERPSTPSVPDRREQVRSERPSDVTPQRPVPPTGGDNPRVFPGQQQPREVPQRPEQVRPERPTPQVPSERPEPRVPPERVSPPTAREVPREQPRQEVPNVREQPNAREVPQPANPPVQERGRGNDKDRGPGGE